MSLILNIDTATEQASICLAREGLPLLSAYNTHQKDHAAWIQPAIQQLMKESGHALKELNAVAVTEGPGSYTGLRVGLATAKGICYALQIPLLTENTLYVMAAAAREQWLTPTAGEEQLPVLLCPMIDARRMEVFTALYDEELQIIRTPNALILDTFSFREELIKNRIIFFGSGSNKWKLLSSGSNALFREGGVMLAEPLSKLAAVRFLQHRYTDLAYAEPVYLKEFYTHGKK